MAAASASLISPLTIAGCQLKFAGKPCVSAVSFKLRNNGSVKCKAAGESFEQTVFPGVYGSWKLEETDVREVILYRSGLVTAASTFVIAASDAFLPNDTSLREIIEHNLDLLYTLGAGGLGLSLILIHIYVTEIKRTLQALWALGVVGSFATYTFLAQPAGKNLIQYVLDNPTAVWFVGPLFAALTGLVFKEGLCYGKLEAGLLTFIIPSVLLGHPTGLMDDGVKLTLLGSWMALFLVFAGRKFTQPIKFLGTWLMWFRMICVLHTRMMLVISLFMFNALQEDEKEALIQELELQKLRQDLN